MRSKKVLAKILFVLIVGSSVTFPVLASAAAWTAPNLWGTPPGFWGPIVSCTGNYMTSNADGTTPNPCTSLCDLIDTFINVVYFAMSLGIFIIAPVSVVISALMIMVSGANPEMLRTGKKALTATVVGLVIILCSYLLVNTFISVLNITGVGGFGNSSCSVTS